jgi:hypothetical protein
MRWGQIFSLAGNPLLLCYINMLRSTLGPIYVPKGLVIVSIYRYVA